MKPASIDADTLADLFLEAASPVLEAWAEAPRSASGGPSGDDVAQALRQFLQVLARLEADAKAGVERLGTDEVTEIGDYGFGLMQMLRDSAERLRMERAQAQLGDLSLPLALWVIRHGGMISQLEAVVDVLAADANRTTERGALKTLADVMVEVLDGAAPQLRHDLEASNPGRPWRVLHLNYGIVATRCHDPERMRDAFDRLIQALPQDAPGFFAEGMRQMDALDYPQHVRDVMEHYHRRYVDQRLH